MRLNRTSRGLPAIGAAVVALAIVGGCAATPPGSANPASPPPSPSSAPSASAVPSPTLTPATPPPTAPPSPTASALPAVGAAPSGPWSRLSWIAAGAVVPVGYSNLQAAFGWSRGYVAVGTSGGDHGNGNVTPLVVTTWSSADGLHWSAASMLDASGLDPSVGIEVGGVLEGPSGLLLVGYESPGTCGGPPAVIALWSSPDGQAWQRNALPKDFRTGRVLTVDGGSAGFIATGTRADGTTQAVWTSSNGRTWTSRPLPKVSTGTLVLDDATSFGGGFVLAGAVLGEDGCGGPAHIHAATWWSADGAAWSRSSLPGSMTAANAGISLRAISDRVIEVTQTSPDGSMLLGWTSTDGRSWTTVNAPSDQLSFGLLTDGRHAALVRDPDSGSGAPTVLGVREDAHITTLEQSGNGPIASEDSTGWTSAVGPTGILVVRYDGGAVWLGLPS